MPSIAPEYIYFDIVPTTTLSGSWRKDDGIFVVFIASKANINPPPDLSNGRGHLPENFNIIPDEYNSVFIVLSSNMYWNIIPSVFKEHNIQYTIQEPDPTASPPARGFKLKSFYPPKWVGQVGNGGCGGVPCESHDSITVTKAFSSGECTQNSIGEIANTVSLPLSWVDCKSYPSIHGEPPACEDSPISVTSTYSSHMSIYLDPNKNGQVDVTIPDFTPISEKSVAVNGTNNSSTTTLVGDSDIDVSQTREIVAKASPFGPFVGLNFVQDLIIRFPGCNDKPSKMAFQRLFFDYDLVLFGSINGSC
eukprot:Nk52_evm13s1636 gene=Nk52_evmTU13s1636